MTEEKKNYHFKIDFCLDSDDRKDNPKEAQTYVVKSTTFMFESQIGLDPILVCDMLCPDFTLGEDEMYITPISLWCLPYFDLTEDEILDFDRFCENKRKEELRFENFNQFIANRKEV